MIYSIREKGKHICHIVGTKEQRAAALKDLLADRPKTALQVVPMPLSTLVHPTECPRANGEYAKDNRTPLSMRRCYCGICDGRFEWCKKCQGRVEVGHKHGKVKRPQKFETPTRERPYPYRYQDFGHRLHGRVCFVANSSPDGKVAVVFRDGEVASVLPGLLVDNTSRGKRK